LQYSLEDLLLLVFVPYLQQEIAAEVFPESLVHYLHLAGSKFEFLIEKEAVNHFIDFRQVDEL